MKELLLQIKIGMPLEEIEKLVILRTLEASKNDKALAAQALGISERTLRAKLKQYLSDRLERAVESTDKL